MLPRRWWRLREPLVISQGWQLMQATARASCEQKPGMQMPEDAWQVRILVGFDCYSISLTSDLVIKCATPDQ